MGTIIEANNLRAYYITKAYGVERTVKAVDGITLRIQEGEVYGIAGESGCGKSTLLRVLLNAYNPPLTVVDGEVVYHLDGERVSAADMNEERQRDLRWRTLSYIPQGSMHVLNPVRRIRDSFHDFISAHRDVSKAESFALTAKYLRDLGLPEKVLASYPHQLSGGMRQRVTIALATILWPKLIFADEPTTALDVVVQRGVIQMLKDVQQKEGSTLILITHDIGVHANLADRIAILYAGKLVEEAATQTILESPRHPYTRFLIESLPSLDSREERLSIPGRPPALDRPPSGCRFHERCPLAKDICKTIEPALIEIAPRHFTACHVVEEELSHASA
ncbi:MAG: ABC transporter ATP-binding protein [Chloroflexi bacterium]|nr:ABC transporter ATP-binding protein [Chloroflexota bacterium]MCY4247703.1 ABC transporter ATP-binding protein [Chloroflexota bacterium]